MKTITRAKPGPLLDVDQGDVLPIVPYEEASPAFQEELGVLKSIFRKDSTGLSAEDPEFIVGDAPDPAWVNKAGTPPPNTGGSASVSKPNTLDTSPSMGGSQGGEASGQPPGPPPRPGLMWKPETHRWIREHAEQASEHMKTNHGTPESMPKGGRSLVNALAAIMEPAEFETVDHHINAWTDSPTSESSMHLQHNIEQMLKDSTGFYGEGEEVDEDLQKGIAKQYEFTQHILRENYPDGVVTLHRGIKLDRGGRKPTNIQINNKPLASWTTNEAMAEEFGEGIITEHIPIENILATPNTNSSLQGFGEDEFLVLGKQRSMKYGTEVGNFRIARR